MLSAEAHSFQRKSRLAISLSWVAGYTNIIAVILTGHVISHTTGNVTLFALSAVNGDRRLILFFAFLVAAFFTGALSSAILTEIARRYGANSKYILPITVEAFLLIVFALAINYHSQLLLPGQLLRPEYLLCGLASLAMGLQNATITRISGAVVRTTHLTGVVTDIGLEIVDLIVHHFDRRPHHNPLRILLLLSIFGSFLFGAIAGAFIFQHWPSLAMIFPVSFLLLIILTSLKSSSSASPSPTSPPHSSNPDIP